MGSVETETLASLLLLPDTIAVEAVYATTTHLTVRVACMLKNAACPLCQHPSERIHGSYGRPVADVPCGGRRVTLALTVRIVGIDDWAWKKGQTYGTIVVDLELRRPIELVPDRSTETVEAWLRAHPEVDIVSRDRGGEYAAAARKGAPQAQQVADRFHVLKNVRERLKDQSVHEIAEPQAETGPAPEKHDRTIPPHPYQRPAGMNYDAFQKQVRPEKRSARYEDVRTGAESASDCTQTEAVSDDGGYIYPGRDVS